MVIRHVQKRIEKLKERPQDERRALAGFIAFGFATLLFLGWSAYGVTNLLAVSSDQATTTANTAAAAAPEATQPQTVSGFSADSQSTTTTQIPGTYTLDQLRAEIDQ